MKVCRVATILDFKYNKIKSLPSWFADSCPTTLKILTLSCNLLESLPTNLYKFVNLESLNLDHNELTEIPVGIGGLNRLVCVNLSGNRLTSLPSDFGEHNEALENVDLSDNRDFFTPLPKFLLQRAKKLTNFSLHSTKLTSILKKGERVSMVLMITTLVSFTQEELNRRSLVMANRKQQDRQRLDDENGQ